KQASLIYRNGVKVYSDNKADPAFVYNINGRFKIYRPLAKNKKDKWRSTALLQDVYGLEHLKKKGRLLFITSSVKDLMTLNSFGFQAICFSSEALPKRGENYEFLKSLIGNLNRRFEYVLSIFDNDEAGKAGAAVLLGLGVPGFQLKAKDPFDSVIIFKRLKTFRVLKKNVKQIVKKTAKCANVSK
ncbi:MAG: hypothetical protein ACRDBG_27315, partial [Waterburya sp.]